MGLEYYKMKIREYIKKNLFEISRLQKETFNFCWRDIQKAALAVIDVYYKKGGTVFLFGNGGSASDAEHFAEELLNRFKNYRIPISACALTAQPAILTGIANDYGFEKVFSRQLEAVATTKDLVIAISTSGKSPSVINGVKLCKTRGITTIGLTGKSGGELAKLADIVIGVPSDDTAHIQEIHTAVGHVICGIIDETLFGEKGFDE
jgi:D-sedoheptulose 7-phosphate isomerase